MKRLAILVAALVTLLPAYAKGPKKGTDIIYLYTKASTVEEAYDIAMRAMLEKGLPIITETPKYNTAKFGPFYAKMSKGINHNVKLYLNIYCMERKNNIVVRVTGTYSSSLDNHRSEEVISKIGMKGSIADQTWNTLLETVRSIPHVYEEYESSGY